MSKLPTFLVIGAMKAGTSSLYAYLNTHPDVFMPSVKEPNFFVAESSWERGVEWYGSLFADAGGARARGEASTNYTKHPQFQGVPDRIRQLIPDVRLVYVVRHPIQRMISHYVHNVSEYNLRVPLEEALRKNPRFLQISDYASQIERFLERFDREQILVMTSESLRHRRDETIARVFRFIDVDPSWVPPNLDENMHRSDEKLVTTSLGRRLPVLAAAAKSERAPAPLRRMAGRLALKPATRAPLSMPPALEAELVETLRPSVARLRAFMDPDWDGWGIA